MTDALYGDNGFYRASGAPARHFRTSAHASPLWADAIAELVRRADAALGAAEELTVVDVGAGGGELLTALAATAPPRWRLIGVDVAPRPDALPTGVEWRESVPDGFNGLLVAVEWLDVVPVDVVERVPDGIRLVEVSDSGAERLGGRVDTPGAAWLQRWWSLHEVGDRAEIGTTRDDAWADAVGHLHRGAALCVDYAVDPHRDVAGTLTGYRDGRQVLPVPDGSCDLTAHVLIESCADAAEVDRSRVMSQRDALQTLGVRAERPAYDGDARSYLRELQQTSEAAELLDRDGLGAFTWLVQAKGIDLPL